MEERRRKALEALRTEHVLRDRDLLDRAARIVTLTPREPDQDETAAFLEKLQHQLPDAIRDESMLREDDDNKIVLVLPGGTIVGALTMKGAGENWTMLIAATTILNGADTELDQIAVDAVNARMPGMLFVANDDYAAFITGAATPTRKADARWRELCIKLAIENHGRAKRFVTEMAGGEEDMITRYWRAERSLTDDMDPDNGNLLLVNSLKNFATSLPEELRPQVRIREKTDTFQLEVPYYRRGRSERLIVRGRYIDGNSGLTWAPAGLHYFAEIEEEGPLEEIVAKAVMLNGMGPEKSESDVRTTPWLLGTWQSTPGATGTRLLYHGYVPSTLVEDADLDEVISGVIAEIWYSRRKLDIEKEIRTLDTEEKTDAQET